jgi:hypothetical protein
MCRCRKQQSGLLRLARSLGPYWFGILTRRMAPPVPKRPSGKKFDVEKLLENDYSATVWIGQSNNCSKDQDNKSAKRKCEDETPLCLLVFRSSDPSVGQNQGGGPQNLPKENELRTHSDCCSLGNTGHRSQIYSHGRWNAFLSPRWSSCRSYAGSGIHFS